MSRLHVMILGQTLSGKTTLAKKLAAEYQRNGIGVIYFDPIGDYTFPCDLRTDCDEELKELVNYNHDCAVFIDEASEVLGIGQRENWRLMTRGRHGGHRVHAISQRGYGAIAPICRGQCSDLFLFATCFDDCIKIGREWNTKDLEKTVPDFPPGQCIRLARNKKPEILRVF